MKLFKEFGYNFHCCLFPLNEMDYMTQKRKIFVSFTAYIVHHSRAMLFQDNSLAIEIQQYPAKP